MQYIAILRKPAFIILLLLITSTAAYAHNSVWLDDHEEWAFTETHNGYVYLVSHAEPRIDVYDIDNEVWIEPLIPPDIPAAFTVDDHGIVIAVGKSLYSVASGSTEFAFLADTIANIAALTSDGQKLYVSINGHGNFRIHDRTSGSLIERRDFFYRPIGMAYSAKLNYIYGRTVVGISPSDILSIELDEPSDSIAIQDSRYHGGYPTATKVWLTPDESHVLDDAGMIYSVPDLVWVGSVADDVFYPLFDGSDLYILTDGLIKLLDSAYREIGRHAVHERAEMIVERDDQLITFYMEDGEAKTEKIAKSTVTLLDREIVDLASLDFHVDDVFRAVDGSHWICSKANRALIKYAEELDSFTTVLALRDEPMAMTAAVDSNALFIGYENGSITRIDLTTGIEVSLTNLASPIHGLVAFEDRLFASDDSGNVGSFSVIDQSGSVIDSFVRNPEKTFVWHAANREIIWAEHGKMSAVSILTDSTFGSARRGENRYRYTGSPSSLSPDNSLILSSEGLVIDATTLAVAGEITDGLVSTVWSPDGFIATLHNPDEYKHGFSIFNNWVTPIELTVWSDTYQPLNRVTFEAHDAHLIESTNGALLFVDEKGKSKPSVFRFNGISSDLDKDGTADSEDEFPIDDTLSSSNLEAGALDILGLILITAYGFFRPVLTSRDHANTA